MTPSNCAGRVATGCVEEIQQGNLIMKCLLQCPTILAVGRAGQCIATLQESGPCKRITDIRCWIVKRLVGKDVAMTIEGQCAIPIRRHLNRVVCSPQCTLE